MKMAFLLSKEHSAWSAPNGVTGFCITYRYTDFVVEGYKTGNNHIEVKAYKCKPNGEQEALAINKKLFDKIVKDLNEYSIDNN